jgi:hypothetical protein
MTGEDFFNFRPICSTSRFDKVSKFQWINLRTEIAWSDLEESAQVVNEIIKDSIILMTYLMNVHC